jgi:hypothetical protein
MSVRSFDYQGFHVIIVRRGWFDWVGMVTDELGRKWLGSCNWTPWGARSAARWVINNILDAKMPPPSRSQTGAHNVTVT